MKDPLTAPVVRDVAVLGAGGHAASVRDVIESAGWHVAVQVDRVRHPDDEAVISEAQFSSEPIWHSLPVVIAVGNNTTRKRIFDRIEQDRHAPPIVASTATVAAVSLGVGTVVHHHAHVGPRASIGKAVIINTSAVVEHDCRVGDLAHVAPSSVLLGATAIGEGAFIGAGAVILPGIEVGDWAVIGAGAVVTRNVPRGQVAAGVPAHPINSNTFLREGDDNVEAP